MTIEVLSQIRIIFAIRHIITWIFLGPAQVAFSLQGISGQNKLSAIVSKRFAEQVTALSRQDTFCMCPHIYCTICNKWFS